MKPNIGKRYTWDQVQKHWYGEQTFLAKRDGRIVCATLVAETNPEAPEVMVVGTKPRNMRRAEEFCEQGGVIPVFIKYAGMSGSSRVSFGWSLSRRTRRG